MPFSRYCCFYMLQPKRPPAGRPWFYSGRDRFWFFLRRGRFSFSPAGTTLVFSPAEADPARLVLRRRVFRFGAGRPAGQALFRIVVIVVIVGKEVIIVRIEIISVIFIRTREIFIFSFLFSRVSIFCQEHFSQHFFEG